MFTVLVRPALAETGCGWPDPDILRAVVPVAGESGSYASGVVVGQDRVLTAAHAIEDGDRLFVGMLSAYREAEILLVDRAKDLAILAVPTGDIPPLRLASNEPRISQQVWAVGYPKAQAKATSMGVFQRVDAGALHTSAPIESGQSGGGLLLCEGGNFLLGGMLRGYGAYLNGDHYIRLKNHSVSVAATTIQRFVDLPTRYQ